MIKLLSALLLIVPITIKAHCSSLGERGRNLSTRSPDTGGCVADQRSVSSHGGAQADSALQKFLPADDILPWQRIAGGRTYSGKGLYEYIDGGAELFYEYGFTEALTQEYAAAERSVVVEIYQMEDAAAAFGIYSLNRDHVKGAAQIGDDATLFDYHLAFWQDNYYVLVMAETADEAMRSSLQNFGRCIAEKIGRHASTPPLISALPEKNRIVRSERWIEGVLGMNGVYYFAAENVWQVDGVSAVAAAADYAGESSSATFIMAVYQSDEKRESAFAKITAVLNERLTPVPHAAGRWHDERGRYYCLEGVGSWLNAVLRGSDTAFAETLLEGARK